MWLSRKADGTSIHCCRAEITGDLYFLLRHTEGWSFLALVYLFAIIKKKKKKKKALRRVYKLYGHMGLSINQVKICCLFCNPYVWVNSALFLCCFGCLVLLLFVSLEWFYQRLQANNSFSTLSRTRISLATTTSESDWNCSTALTAPAHYVGFTEKVPSSSEWRPPPLWLS